MEQQSTDPACVVDAAEQRRDHAQQDQIALPCAKKPSPRMPGTTWSDLCPVRARVAKFVLSRGSPPASHHALALLAVCRSAAITLAETALGKSATLNVEFTTRCVIQPAEFLCREAPGESR